MKKNLKKVFVSLLTATTIFTSTGPVLANKITVNMPYSIYQNIEKNNISSGVVHEKIMRFTTAGWWNINVLRINLLDPHTEIKSLINPNGMPSRDKVSSMVEKHNAVAGINGDFFNYSPMPSTLGALIENGELLTARRDDAKPLLPGFFVDFLNNANIDYFQRTMEATNLTKGNKININAVNNVSTYFDAVTLLNKHWGPKSIGTKFHNDLVEVVVKNDIVTDVRVGQEAIDIPEDGYVLIVRGYQKSQELQTFSVGDSIELNISSTPDINNIKFSIGGGSYILKNGELNRPDLDSPGNAPRTGIGINKDGTEVILVTIDGRDTSFKGVTQEMFGAIFKELGAYNALNLDGGGSTAMAIKPVDSQKAVIVNKPSEGAERPVVNGVGVFSNAPVGELSYIKVSTDDSNMFINTTRKFTVKGYDQYHNPVTIDESKLVFTQEGVNGNIAGNSFKALSQGKAKITANYDNITNSIDINVLGNVKDLTTDMSNFNIDINSEKTLPIFYGKDENGYQAKIYPEDITFTTINNIGSVTNGIFYSADTSVAGVLTAKLGEGIENILVSIGSEGKLVERFESLDNLRFSAYPETVIGGIGLSSDAKEGNSSISLKYDFSQGENTRAAYLTLMNGENIGLPIQGVPRKLGLWVNGDNSGSWLRGTIKDNKGNSHTIDFVKTIDWTGWQFVTTNIPSNVSYPIVLEKIYPVETDNLKKQSGELLFDGLTAFYPPTLGNIVLPTPSTLKDSKNIKTNVNKDGFSFAVFMEPKGLNQLVKYDASSKIKSKINTHKIAISLNGMSNEFVKGLTNYARIDASGAYKRNKHQDVAFINVNTGKNGIRETNAEQWNKLKADLNGTTENNIVLLFPTPIFGSNGFTDTLEADLLHKHLVETREKGKNIFVVHGGNSNTSDLKDGIRYIGLNTKTLGKPEDIYDLSIIEFTVNGSDVTYTVSPLFEKPGVKVGK
ncbi:phosphodiester glycosidase family protein [uncultured Tissierella sp.]|jgi:exopolysaccharide biosynthesis protein|uniref:phosphodiester glycosidase family protein n=1 Tax=uncultured Tissierella sp. TaxID=448160 RepID=UPI002803C39C|nr:phosphodiester glycosidase family protein [uncultured Tissierella sp.]MDU5079784.1 phosphodiester glycosidase family protein [Bacillota bacterium]